MPHTLDRIGVPDLVGSLEGRSRLLVVLLRVLSGVSAAWLLTVALAYFELSRLPSARSIDDVNTFWVIASGSIALGMTVLALVTLVVFLMWVYRSTQNLRAFTKYPVRSTPGWAVGWYFVPIAFLFMPFRGMIDIWNASHGDDSSRNWLVKVWWALVLVNAIVWQTTNYAPDGNTVRDYMRLTIVEAPGYVLDVAMYGVTLMMVAAIARAYRANIVEWALVHPSITPGWYPDPAGTADLRYWDGSHWADDVRAGAAAPVAPYSDDASGQIDGDGSSV